MYNLKGFFASLLYADLVFEKHYNQHIISLSDRYNMSLILLRTIDRFIYRFQWTHILA